MKKICKGCSGRIEENKEKYVHIEDWNKKELTNDSWWHLKCFIKSMNRDLTILEKKAASMLNKADTIFNNLPDEFKEEAYVI